MTATFSNFKIDLTIRCSCFLQILSRVKSDSANSRQSASGIVGKKSDLAAFDEFLLKRDYTGARTLLEVNRLHKNNVFRFDKFLNFLLLQFNAGASRQEALIKQWTAFCNFHVGNYKLALDEYEQLRKSDDADVNGNDIELNIAICMFYLGERVSCRPFGFVFV